MIETENDLIMKVFPNFTQHFTSTAWLSRDGWIYITNSKANDDKVVFVCNGEDGGTQRRQNADWSIPTSVLTAPRHIIIQVQRSHVSLFEKTGDGLRHIASRTCPRPFPSFPYFTVKTQCYGQYCPVQNEELKKKQGNCSRPG
ncbi:hypothetical protein Pcinc_000695 [Petrolisthes cinctipes]|uniref:Uncharacterized protein n=1 Tax=Petrolisthes cinctipes TaxID=88211 RepID=A0AAE1GP50_PETCI|nr:hypothetical protein Pcinc_000695 [Petrolisthes cinctipes]